MKTIKELEKEKDIILKRATATPNDIDRVWWIDAQLKQTNEIIKLIEERRKKIEGLWKATGVSDYYYCEMVLGELKAKIRGGEEK